MSNPVPYTSPRAVRDPRRLDEPARRRTVEAINLHVRTRTGDVRRLKGRNKGTCGFASGTGAFFFVYEPDRRTIVINRVVHRSQAYRGNRRRGSWR